MLFIDATGISLYFISILHYFNNHILQIRGGGNQRIIHKNAWALYQTQLIRSIHNIYDLLFAHISETFEYTQSSEYEIPKLPYDDNLSNVEPIARAITLFTRFKNLCTYLEVALL